MTKKGEREERIRRDTSNVSLEDFESLIKQYGHIKEGSKHPLAIIGKRVFPYKRTNPVHKPYVDKVIEILDSINKQEKGI